MMNREPHQDLPLLASEFWNCSSSELCLELESFLEEFESFTPELFAQLRFDLFRKGLVKKSRSQLCSVAAYIGICCFCTELYQSKSCLLWYKLYRLVSSRSLKRSPPCIRTAYKKKSIKTVANFLNRVNVLDAPHYDSRAVPYCKTMERFGYCAPDSICNRMDGVSPLEYNRIRTTLRSNGIW